jgi:hypothetical protein
VWRRRSVSLIWSLALGLGLRGASSETDYGAGLYFQSRSNNRQRNANFGEGAHIAVTQDNLKNAPVGSRPTEAVHFRRVRTICAIPFIHQFIIREQEGLQCYLALFELD